MKSQLPEVKVNLEMTSMANRSKRHQRMTQLGPTWQNDISDDVGKQDKVHESA